MNPELYYMSDDPYDERLLGQYDITLVRVRTFLGEDVIPFTPNQQGWGLVDAKIFLPLWIKRWVGPIAVKQLELDLFVARTVKQKLVVKPVIR